MALLFSARKIRLMRVNDAGAQMVAAAGQRFGLERMKDGITRIANGLPEEPNLC